MVVTEQKKGFFGKFFPPKKPKLTAEDVNNNLNLFQTFIEKDFSEKIGERLNSINFKIEALIKEIKSLKENNNIPAEWQKTINKMQEYNEDLPDASIIYKVLMAYKNLNSKIAEANKENTVAKINQIKTQADKKEIHNCAKCGKPLKDGEYYKYKDKIYCLVHKNEPIKKGDDAL